MKKYKAVFFDLDHTLWDFEKNSTEALTELFDIFNLKEKGIDSNAGFIDNYKTINTEMWNLYHDNKISRETLRNGRFERVLGLYNIHDNRLALQMGDEYLALSPKKSNLFPGTLELLGYLSEKYSLHIITNGFREVQYIKINSSGLNRFFDHIHISEEVGYKKPAPEIFHHAVRTAGTVNTSCIMIGDNIDTDITGAKNAGIDHILFNPHGDSVPETGGRTIRHLKELEEIL